MSEPQPNLAQTPEPPTGSSYMRWGRVVLFLAIAVPIFLSPLFLDSCG